MWPFTLPGIYVFFVFGFGFLDYWFFVYRFVIGWGLWPWVALRSYKQMRLFNAILPSWFLRQV